MRNPSRFTSQTRSQGKSMGAVGKSSTVEADRANSRSHKKKTTTPVSFSAKDDDAPIYSPVLSTYPPQEGTEFGSKKKGRGVDASTNVSDANSREEISLHDCRSTKDEVGSRSYADLRTPADGDSLEAWVNDLFLCRSLRKRDRFFASLCDYFPTKTSLGQDYPNIDKGLSRRSRRIPVFSGAGKAFADSSAKIGKEETIRHRNFNKTAQGGTGMMGYDEKKKIESRDEEEKNMIMTIDREEDEVIEKRNCRELISRARSKNRRRRPIRSPSDDAMQSILSESTVASSVRASSKCDVYSPLSACSKQSTFSTRSISSRRSFAFGYGVSSGIQKINRNQSRDEEDRPMSKLKNPNPKRSRSRDLTRSRSTDPTRSKILGSPTSRSVDLRRSKSSTDPTRSKMLGTPTSRNVDLRRSKSSKLAIPKRIAPYRSRSVGHSTTLSEF